MIYIAALVLLIGVCVGITGAVIDNDKILSYGFSLKAVAAIIYWLSVP